MKRKILIIDDSEEYLRIMYSAFEQHRPDYKIYQTKKPEQAIKIALLKKPDVIITDWDMPEISGIELISQFKNEPELKNIPIIMATGFNLSSEDLQLALDTGASDYLRKPIDDIELIARTNSALTIADYYNEIIKQKNHELAESSLALLRNHEYIKDISLKLNIIKKQIKNNPQALKTLSKLEDETKQHFEEHNWYRFNLAFNNVHPAFNQNLIKAHPQLSPAEIKLCAFIVLGMSNKDIAAVLNKTADGIKVTRYRIRKKMGLEHAINLQSYLTRF